MANGVPLFGAVAAFVGREFGGDYEVNESNPTVGTSASVVAANNPGRAALAIINTSANTLYLRSRGVPTSTNGIILNAGGGSLILNMTQDLLLPSYEWQALASAAGSTVYVLEVVLIRARSPQGA